MGFHKGGHNQSWLFTREVASTDLPTPNKEKSWDSWKKNLEILQKVVRYYFFPIKIKQTLFPL